MKLCIGLNSFVHFMNGRLLQFIINWVKLLKTFWKTIISLFVKIIFCVLFERQVDIFIVFMAKHTWRFLIIRIGEPSSQLTKNWFIFRIIKFFWRFVVNKTAIFSQIIFYRKFCLSDSSITTCWVDQNLLWYHFWFLSFTIKFLQYNFLFALNVTSLASWFWKCNDCVT